MNASIFIALSIPAALEYPYSQPEEGSFESFGTAVLTTKDAAGKLSQRTVTLVWNVDELQLLQGPLITPKSDGE